MEVNASLGRTLGDADDRSGAPPVAVISDRIWWRRFGGDASVIGKMIHVNNVSATVVGVMPPFFHGASGRGGACDIFLPLSVAREIAPDATDHWRLYVMGRLKPGATAEQVRSEFAGPFHAAATEGCKTIRRKFTGKKARAFRGCRSSEVRTVMRSRIRGRC